MQFFFRIWWQTWSVKNGTCSNVWIFYLNTKKGHFFPQDRPHLHVTWCTSWTRPRCSCSGLHPATQAAGRTLPTTSSASAVVSRARPAKRATVTCASYRRPWAWRALLWPCRTLWPTLTTRSRSKLLTACREWDKRQGRWPTSLSAPRRLVSVF